MAFKITAPNEKYTGVSHGVAFHNGKGETNDAWLAEQCKISGFEVEGQAPEQELDSETAPDAPAEPEEVEAPKKTSKKK